MKLTVQVYRVCLTSRPQLEGYDNVKRVRKTIIVRRIRNFHQRAWHGDSNILQDHTGETLGSLLAR
jgi:hypothetical protein